jgi:tyrosyl-DNA phosphodiesterase 2
MVSPQARTLNAYSFVVTKWQTTDSVVLSAPTPLKVLTWNVWFGAHEFHARYKALFTELSRRNPDVILLQEVTLKLLIAIKNDPWIRAHYQLSDIDGYTLNQYGVLLLSRVPIQRLVLVDLPTEMDRRLLVAQLSCGLTISTAHLESTSYYSKTRATQLDVIQRYLVESSTDFVLAGDMNFKPDAELENATLDPTLIDVWTALHGNDPGYTVDTNINFMRYVMDGEHSHKRIDRFFLHSHAWIAQSAELVGTTPIDNEGNFISDHFGLEVEIAPLTLHSGNESSTIAD